MDATYQTLAGALDLGEFTVAVLAAHADVKATTVRTVLRRHRSFFDVAPAVSGRPGGQPQIWSVREGARPELAALLDETATRFSENDGSDFLTDRLADRSPLRVRAPSGNPELLDADDLQTLAPHRAARELLPRMVRQLLQASAGVTNVSVRAGDGIGLPGLDGLASSTVESRFVPGGRSVWELGTSADSRRKAEEDYRKRTDSPSEVDRSATVYVAVAMRRFADKEAWAAHKREEGVWRDVRVLDADDLHAWLEESPAVHVSVSQEAGLYPQDVTTLEDWWSAWSTQTDPQIPSGVLLAGRQDQTRTIRQMLSEPPRSIAVFAPSREESLGFVAAALLDTSQDAHSPAPPIALIVKTPKEWARLCNVAPGLVLVPGFESSDIAAAIRAHHHVIIPIGPGDDSGRADIDLPRVDREAAREALQAAGLELDEADRSAAHVRRSLASFRRSRAVNPAVTAPPWTMLQTAAVLAPLVLIGSWSIGGAEDHELVGMIAGRPYEEVERLLRSLLVTSDPPFVQSGESWQLSAPEDAWTLLKSHTTSVDIERWVQGARKVLAEVDPVLDLPHSERLLAGIRGVRRTYSSTLRRGVAQGAALLGVSLDTGPDGRPWSDTARTVVSELLSTSDKNLWPSLADVLPLLAEASPDAFLSSATAALAGTEPALLAMFEDSADATAWHSSSPHTGLLWALELLAWSTAYLADVCDLLARLTEVDPGGRLSNRPLESLRRILLSWYPQTTASLRDRLDVVAGLLQRRPTTGWSLLLGLLPQLHDSTHSTYKPIFRDWDTSAPRATLAEALTAADRLVALAVEHLAQFSEHWPAFIRSSPALPPEALDVAVTALEALEPTTIDEPTRLAVWSELTKVVESHRRFQTADWALPEPALERLARVAARWEPTNLPERHARLFDWHPDIAGLEPYDHDAYEAALTEARRSAVLEVLAGGDSERLDRLIGGSRVPGFVGATVADVAGDAYRGIMLAHLGVDGRAREAAYGWVVRMCELHGKAWVEQMIQDACQLPEQARTDLYLALPNGPTVWAAASTDSAIVGDEYWRKIGVLRVEADDTVEFVDRLIEHGRPWSAIDLLAHRAHDPEYVLPSELILRVLHAAAMPSDEPPHIAGSPDYDIGVLLDRLERDGVEDQVLVELEWAFFTLLEHSREPRKLYSALATEPEFFVQLVCWAFRGIDEPERKLDDAGLARAQQSFRVLRTWRKPPGLTNDGRLDADEMRQWINRARELLARYGRSSVGDECIGEVFSGAPAGQDGMWPPEPIRDLLETLEAPEIGQGLAIGQFNSRGVSSRGVYDGGKQERALADQYDSWSRAIMARWPMAGRLLREMASSYRGWAQRQDDESARLADS